MANSYFEYALLQCQLSSISNICSVDSTTEALLERASGEFNGCNNITADHRLLKAVAGCLQNHDVIIPNRLDNDAKTIYDRCITFFEGNPEIGYERCFDHLVELNWLLASIHSAKETRKHNISLLIDPEEILNSIKSHLRELYNSAVHDNNECVYIQEALQAKKIIFSGLYNFQYDSSRYYLSDIFSRSDLEKMESDYRKNSIRKISLFYGLTATAALAESIRRFG